MSKSLEKFSNGIEDARNMLAIYDCHNSSENAEIIKGLYKGKLPDIDVLKRFSFTLAFTAFETYIEDLVREIEQKQITPNSTEKNEKMLERFHNPNTENIRNLYKIWFCIEDVTCRWSFDGMNREQVCKKLDDYIRNRGEIVHRLKEDNVPDVAKRDNVVKCVNFLDKLARCMDEYIASDEWVEDARKKRAEKAQGGNK